jgi:cysteine desulfurase/selenocysteine lyase
MSRLYLDNAATSFPKPESVYKAVEDCLRNVGSAHGRSGTRGAMTVQSLVERARSGVARLLGASRPDRVVFTAGGTDGLNLVLRGLLRPGDHVVAGSVEHNSVLRPLRALEAVGVRLSLVPPRCGVVLDENDFRAAMRPDTRLVVVQHASNVTGERQPVEKIANLAHAAGALVLVDAAQTVGSMPLDVRALGCDFLAAPAHKGLLAPLGTGFVWFGDGMEERVESLRQGGTGTASELETQPSTMPDKYEAGNPNGPGLAGLAAAVAWLEQTGVDIVAVREREAVARFRDELAGEPGVELFRSHSSNEGPDDGVGVVSLRIAGYDPRDAAMILDESFEIDTRPGLHCAPGAHRALGTDRGGGTVRFSFGPFTTPADAERAADAVRQIARSAP